MKDMDMKALDRRVKNGVRSINISPLFEAGKLYNIDRGSQNYQKEDANGTMRPQKNHCWVTWESKYFDSNDGKEKWCKEAYSFESLEEAKEAETYLKEFVA